MMDQETVLRRLAMSVQNDGDGPFTHAIIPGLFRAAILKPRNNKNCQRDDCHQKRGMKRLGKSKNHLQPSNFSIADLILIGDPSRETVLSDHTHPSCPAYRFCVERATAAASLAGVTVDREDSVISSELPTLRELLEPIKQSALRMKRLSEATDECCEPESDIVIGDTSTCEICGLKVATTTTHLDEPEAEKQFEMFGEGDKMQGIDGNVFVRIISRPDMETGQLTGDPLMTMIQQLISQMPNIQQEQSKPVTSVVDEYRQMQDIGIQSPGCSKEINNNVEDDAASVQSYEFITTMDIGCGGEPEAGNNDVLFHGGMDYQNNNDETLNPLLLSILTILKNNQQANSIKLNGNQTDFVDPSCSMEPKSRTLKDFTNETTLKQDKSVDCTCGLNLQPPSPYSEVKSGKKVEVTNAVSFKSSYVLENLETMNVTQENQSGPPACCSKDVSTSTYKISIIKQITSMSQSKITTSRKRSSSSQCDIGPASIRKLSCNDDCGGNKKLEQRKPANLKERDGIPETIEELCPCGCGFFLEGDDTCLCGCDESQNSTQLASKLIDQNRYTIDSMADSTMLQESNAKVQQNFNYCSCEEDTEIKDIPLDPVVKMMNCTFASDCEIMRDPLKANQDNMDVGTDLEEEARKLQQKIQSYRKENEHIRKLIQQACNGCPENMDALSRTPPIRATYSGLATAIEILQAKCRSKDGMIAILAEGLRGVANYAQIAKNLAAPCLEYTYWDFDQSALYTYLRGTMSRLSVEARKSCDWKEDTCPSKTQQKEKTSSLPPPPPTDFKIEQLCKCLFVSWKIPENISNVAGYRIYVNGNLTTNVRSPTRTETILGFMDMTKPTELALHSFNKEDVLSDPVTITYYPDSMKKNNQ